ncbi:MAG TPA: hypothetical protein VF721_21080 [Pyrinomonadaceae bacterium]|jgi:hypothetical protein
MKNQINFWLISLLLIIPITLTSAKAQTSDALPTLRGEDAVKQLKQNGQYDSLMEAVKAARKENGQTDEGNGQDAVGQSAKLTPSDGAASDRFGYSVAVSGDTAIVGAYLNDVGANTNQGSAYIFTRSGTTWSQQAQLTAADGAAGDLFGFSVAISGETVIVGAYQDDVGANTNQGSAYIFIRSGTTWSQQAQLLASDGAQNDQFGYSVAISGNTVIVGAYLNDVGANGNQGSAYIFIRSGITWSQQAQLTAADGAQDDQFGSSVAISDDTAIVGAYLDDVGANADQGSAYIFVRSGTTWSQQAQLLASDGAADDRFGVSVSISGDTVIVGAVFDDVGANAEQGSAYIFVRSGTIWSQQAQLTASDGAAGDLFGISVAISGNTVIVGADGDDVGANSDQGSAYIFVRSGTTWSQQPQLTASDGAAGDQFGVSVAVSGNNIIVGAVFDDVGANVDQGSAYVFRVLSPNWAQEAKKVASDGAASDQFGISVAISGDTAIVGAHLDFVGANREQGSAYVFVRSGTTWSQQAQLLASDGAQDDHFGISVAISGNTVIVGAYFDDVGANADQGSAYIFIRSGTTWSQQAQLTAADGAANDLFGRSVAISGETAIVGAYLNDAGANADQGSAYIFGRVVTNWTERQQLTAADGAADDRFGFSVSISGNTVIVGAYQDDIGSNSNQGSAYIFIRSGTIWSQQAQLTAADGAANDQFGISVAISGETAIVGAYFDDVGANADQGSAYIFVRSGTTWSQQPQLLASDGAADDRFGISVSISGDTVIVGAYQDDVGANADQGSAYVFERAGTAWTQKAKLVDNSGAAGDRFGFGVSISGDKIVVGAPLSDASVSTPLASENEFSPQATDQGAAIFFVNAPLAPTAANVSIGGRVFAGKGRGLANAAVYLTDQQGNTRMTRTNPFGYYWFEEIEVGQTVVIAVVSKRFVFAPRVIQINEELTEVNFTAQQ